MSRRDGRDEYYPERRPAPRDARDPRDRDPRDYRDDRGYGRDDRHDERPRDRDPRDRDYDRPDRPRDSRDAYDRRDPRDRDYDRPDRSDRPPRGASRDRDYEDRPRDPRDARNEPSAPRDRDYGDRRDPDRRERDYTLPKSVRFGGTAGGVGGTGSTGATQPPTRESFLASLRPGAQPAQPTQPTQPTQPSQASEPSSSRDAQTEPAKQGETNGAAQNGEGQSGAQPGRYAYTRLPDMRKQAMDMVRAYLEQKDWSLIIGAVTPDLQEEYLNMPPNTPHVMNMMQVALREIWKWDRRYRRRPQNGKPGVPNPDYGKDITADYAEVLVLIDVACPGLWKDEKYAPFEPRKNAEGRVENPRYDFLIYTLALMSQVAATLIKRTFTPVSDRQTAVAQGVTLKYVENKKKDGSMGIGISTTASVGEGDLTSPPPIDKQSKVYMAQLSKDERRMYMEMNNLRGRGARARYDDEDEEYEGD